VLVLVSFVLVLAAAVTLVVGLLQSGLTLIYLSIGCSVLAGVVLAVAVLRGRPEGRPATTGRAFTPPPREQVPVAVGAPSSAETTSSWSAPPAAARPASTPTPTPPPPSAPARSSGDDAATKAAGTALLGRLRGRKTDQDSGGEPTVIAAPPAPEPAVSRSDATGEMPIVSSPASAGEDEDGFPIADYDRLRATELLAQLPTLDRNQLEAVRERESSGKNRFTIMSRIDSLLAGMAAPAWEADDDAWEDEAAEPATAADDEAALDADLAIDRDDAWQVDDDEVDELVAPASAGAGSEFPIPGYDTLTVGQILPRLSDLSADELADVRARELQGRNRGTVLDRIDRLSARAGARPGAGAMAMPPAPAVPPPTPRKTAARKTAARKTVARKATGRTAAPEPVAPAPMAEAVKKARAPRAAKVVSAPEPVKAATRKAAPRKAAVAAPVPAPAATKAPARKSSPRKAAAPATPAPAPATPMKDAVKKARATKRS
jgi:hypothetical protein